MYLFIYSSIDFYTNEVPLQFGGLQPVVVKTQDSPIERDLHLSLDDIFHGCTKKIKISRRVGTSATIFSHHSWHREQLVHMSQISFTWKNIEWIRNLCFALTDYEWGWIHVQYQRQDSVCGCQSWLERWHQNRFPQRGRSGKRATVHKLISWWYL